MTVIYTDYKLPGSFVVLHKKYVQQKAKYIVITQNIKLPGYE